MYTYIYIFEFVYMAHHFILLRLNSFGIRFDREGWWFEHSMSWLPVCLSAEVLKTYPGPGYLHYEDGVV